MSIRFLSCFTVASISFFLSLPVMAQSPTKPDSVDSNTPRTSEIMTEGTSPTESNKPTEINDPSKTPESKPSTTLEVNPETNTTEEIKKDGTATVESVENPELVPDPSQSEAEIRPTNKVPETSAPNTLKK